MKKTTGLALTDLGKAVRKRLIDLDMNDKELADKLGISGPYLCYILYGQRKAGKQVERIVNLLGLDPKFLEGTNYSFLSEQKGA